MPPRVRDVFLQFDRDRSGKLDTRELRRALEELGLQTSLQEAAQLLARYDGAAAGSKDRLIDIHEFNKVCADVKAFQAKEAHTAVPQRVRDV